MLILVLCAIVIAFIFTLAYKWKKLADALPPGPKPVPFFGNLLQFDNDPRETSLKWHKQYGPMYTVWLGLKPQVHVTNYQLMHELFVKRGDEFVDRPDEWTLEYFTDGK